MPPILHKQNDNTKYNRINQIYEMLKNNVHGMTITELSKAKALTIKFGFHKNQSLFIITDYMSQIHDLTNIDTEIIFGTENIDDIDENLLRYEIIVTGIE